MFRESQRKRYCSPSRPCTPKTAWATLLSSSVSTMTALTPYSGWAMHLKGPAVPVLWSRRCSGDLEGIWQVVIVDLLVLHKSKQRIWFCGRSILPVLPIQWAFVQQSSSHHSLVPNEEHTCRCQTVTTEREPFSPQGSFSQRVRAMKSKKQNRPSVIPSVFISMFFPWPFRGISLRSRTSSRSPENLLLAMLSRLGSPFNLTIAWEGSCVCTTSPAAVLFQMITCMGLQVEFVGCINVYGIT